MSNTEKIDDADKGICYSEDGPSLAVGKNK